MRSITYWHNYLISITTCQQARCQLSARSICSHVPHSITPEGCSAPVLAWLCLSESKKNEMLPALLNYECLCVSHGRRKQRKKRSKSGYRKLAVKSNGKALLGESLREILAVTLFLSQDHCSHLISKSWEAGHHVIVYKWISALKLNSLFKGRLPWLYLQILEVFFEFTSICRSKFSKSESITEQTNCKCSAAGRGCSLDSDRPEGPWPSSTAQYTYTFIFTGVKWGCRGGHLSFWWSSFPNSSAIITT